ncbi:ABC transporter ATP-binding protein [Longimicrobium sp.]|uniref:ABC transporter ATP-binding protein n=1 Tax=Longimicrobium sp. TaxID=2029185 RepID=UPI003B3A878B
MLRKLYELLSARERKRFGWLLVAIVLMGFFETLGVASILPFMQLVSNPAAIQEHQVLRRAYGWSGADTSNQFLILVGAGVLVLLTVSNAVRGFTQWLQFRTVWVSAHGLSVRLLERYVTQPYDFFLRSSSTDLGKEVLMEMGELVKSVLVPLTDLAARLFVSLSLLVLLLAVDPKLALSVAGVLGTAYGLIYLVFRRALYRLGQDRYTAGRQRFKSATEALQGIKAVKIGGRERYFLDKFTVASERYTSIQPTFQAISRTPRYFVETLAFGGILVIVLYLLTTQRTLTNVVPLLSLYALAGYRLLPAMQEIFSAVSQVRYHAAVVETIHEQFMRQTVRVELPAASAQPLPLRQAITLQDLRFQYAGTDRPTLDGIDLVIPRNGSVAFVGPTGSGKSTLIDILVGLLQPHEGCVRVDGVPVTAENVRQWQASIGYVPQEAMLFDDTVLRNIVFGVEEAAVDRARVEQAARVARIHDFIMNELPQGYETTVGERGIRLSGGQRQRIGLARALYRQPSVLILDEATSALDGVTEEEVMEAIAGMRDQVTMIMVAHRLTTVADCDQIYLLDGGRVTDQGTYGELIASNHLFRGMAKAVQ